MPVVLKRFTDRWEACGAAETQRQSPTDSRSQSPVIPPSFWDDNEMFCVLHDDELYALDFLGFQPRQPADFCPAKRLSE